MGSLKSIICLIIFLYTAPQLAALNYNVAIKNWVAFHNDFAGFTGKGHPDYDISSTGDEINHTLFCINPSANIRFDNTNSLALNFIYSGYERFIGLNKTHDINANAAYDTSSIFNITNYDYSLDKIDADVLYNRKINTNFTFFGGLKYVFLYSNCSFSQDNFPSNNEERDALSEEDLNSFNTITSVGGFNLDSYSSFTQHSYGPGLGIGFNYNIAGYWFVLAGVSETLLYAQTKTEYGRYNKNLSTQTVEEAYFVPSTNMKLTAAYFMASTRITFEGGLQAQYYMYTAGSDKGTLDNETFFLFGPICNVIFSF